MRITEDNIYNISIVILVIALVIILISLACFVSFTAIGKAITNYKQEVIKQEYYKDSLQIELNKRKNNEN